jgi:glycosyltransferase involved in cell wall biosynthesis
MDAYGGITLTAVGLGVPVIGTRQAGSAVELIHDGENGFLYEAEDVSALTKHLVEMIRDEKLREAMARASHALSANWTAEHLADTLVQRLFKDGILHG